MRRVSILIILCSLLVGITACATFRAPGDPAPSPEYRSTRAWFTPPATLASPTPTPTPYPRPDRSDTALTPRSTTAAVPLATAETQR